MSISYRRFSSDRLLSFLPRPLLQLPHFGLYSEVFYLHIFSESQFLLLIFSYVFCSVCCYRLCILLEKYFITEMIEREATPSRSVDLSKGDSNIVILPYKAMWGAAFRRRKMALLLPGALWSSTRPHLQTRCRVALYMGNWLQTFISRPLTVYVYYNNISIKKLKLPL
jgi:hypothetical protein